MIANDKYFKYTVWVLLVVLIVYLFGQLGFILNFIKIVLMIAILPTLVASLFYYLLRPLVRYLVEKKFNKTIAVIGVLLILIALIVLLTTFAGRTISREFSSFFETLTRYVQELPKRAENLLAQDELWIFSLEDIESNLLDTSQIAFQSLRENMSGWVTNITDFGTVVILIPIIVYFLLKDDELIYSNMIKAIPPKYKSRVMDIIGDIDDILENYYIGQLKVAGFLGVLTYIGYLVIGLPNAMFLATFSMFFSIIPFLGPLIGILPALFIGWTVNPLMIGKVLIVLIITQQLEGNVVRPKIMGNRLDIHPMVIIFLVIMAVTMYGFIGAFFVIPLYAMLRTIFKHIIFTD